MPASELRRITTAAEVAVRRFETGESADVTIV